MSSRETGHTKGAGWEIGVSRTVPHSVGDVWDFLTSKQGASVWLGSGVQRVDETGRGYETTDGTTGEVRGFRARDRLRLTWRPVDWNHDSTVQVAVSSPGADRTTVTFHQERLADSAEREQQRAHWQAVMDALITALDERSAP